MTETVMDAALAEATENLRGNPFAGIGMLMLENSRPVVKRALDMSIKDVCQGKEPRLLVALRGY